MAQSPYFSGHGGQHSPNPPGAAQMLGQANASIAAGIMKLSDEIGDSLKRRGQEAKQTKKEGEVAKQMLKLVANHPDNKGLVPGYDTTVDEVDNLTPSESITMAKALTGFQEITGKSAQNRLTRTRADIGEKDVQSYEARLNEASQLTKAQTDVARQTVESRDFDTNTKKATLSLVADMATMPTPFGAMDDAEAFQMKMGAALAKPENQGADVSAGLAAHNEMVKAAKGPFKPSSMSIPLPDGTTQTAVMTSPNSVQLIEKYSPQGKQFEKIKDEDGKVVAIGMPDGKGGFITGTIKHLKDGFKPSDFDLDGSGWLTGAELTDFKFKFSDGEAYKMMMFDLLFKPTVNKAGETGINIGLPPTKKSGSKKPGSKKSSVPGTADEVKSAFQDWLKGGGGKAE